MDLPTDPRPTPVRLLLVDDDDDNLTALETMLEPLGFELVRARTGAEALDAVFSAQFALLLVDVRMPGLAGLRTLAGSAAREPARHTPILFLTADGSPEQITLAYQHGATDFLARPIAAQVLRSKVGIFVELHQHRLAARAAAALGRA